MRVILCLLLAAVCVLADKNGINKDRRTKPFIADAVGNTLPPPSNVPATVGSPISLLTPDRYEFYTFDESGELVKRLMTLEEIQAIVAAGEDSDGMVTFENDNQPTIAFNFSQPPYTKVHSVVTNVQNVLKAQMEAHKNNPLVQPTLDTPDVSDSWSLILPSIFGNSGVDIVPEKAASSFVPETETIEQSINADDEENSLSKEGGTQISSSTSAAAVSTESKTTVAEPTKTTLASSTSTTTAKSTTTTKKITTTARPTSTTTRRKLVTTTRPRTTTTLLPITTKLTTTSTTVKPSTTTTTPKTTTTTPATTTKKQSVIISTTKEYISNDIPTAAKPVSEFEKISTFIPVSTVKYVTESVTKSPQEITKVPFVYTTTKKSPLTTTKAPNALSSTIVPKVQTTITTSKPSTTKIYVTIPTKDPELERINLTTLTTQSVSPSTTVSSTEFLSIAHLGTKDHDPIIPMFDVAQSISQIASDLGNSYQPIPTSSNIQETTKVNEPENMESKETLDMDIPYDEQNKNKNEDNFVKISTIDPHPDQNVQDTEKKPEINDQTNISFDVKTTTEREEITTVTSIFSESTTMDPILTESMEDLLSQVVNEAPKPSLDAEKTVTSEINHVTTDNVLQETTMVFETSSEQSTSKNIIATINKNQEESEQEPVQETIKPESEIKTTTEKVSAIIISTDKPVSDKDTTKAPVAIKVTTDKSVHVQTTSTEKLISVEKEKLSSAAHNKVSIDDKQAVKLDDSKDFVKISESSNIELNKNNKENDTQTELNKISTPQREDNLDKKVVTEQKLETTNNEPTLEINTGSSKVETTTKPYKSSVSNNKNVSQSNINKIISIDKITPNNKKDKVPELSTKVEEFKKKIQKVNDEELLHEINVDPWKLIPTVTPPKGNDVSKEKFKPEAFSPIDEENKNVILDFSKENQGLEVTTKDLGEDIAQFTELCNELAFRYWNTMVENIDKKRSFVLSPYSITSMLAMMFMGARGSTSGEMNEILKLDDMVTFNPHFTLKNISDSIESASNSGISVSAFVRELFSDRTKGKILTFYKERAQHFYSGHVEEINFKLISDIIRRRTNLLVKKHTWGKIPEYMKTNSIVMKPPLAAFSTNIFQTDCTGTSVDGRDGEMYFVVSPNVRQRRLVPVPAVVYKTGFLAGYDPSLDATAAALGNINSIVSTILLMPGQQGNIVHADDLEKLEQRLLESNPTTPVWSRVLRTLLPRAGLELQIPRFSHKSVFNVSSTLREMGLKDLFDANHADLGGLNGPSKDLYLSDMIQMTSFVTCGEAVVGEQHHIEEYPDSLSVVRRRASRWADWDEPRDYQRAFHDPHDVGEAMHLPLHLRPRQARVPTRSVQPARLKFDRPFLFFVRHNPSGMILYVGRYNPRLLP